MIRNNKVLLRYLKKYEKLVYSLLFENNINTRLIDKVSKKLHIEYYSMLIILKDIKKDFEFFKVSDLSLKQDEEIFYLNPFKAIMYYRLAHFIYLNNDYVVSRMLSEYAHSITQIDINPGSIIGSPFYIDHGTGIVIGETCIIGKYVKLYHGVTLGAKLSPNENKLKRHPTIEDNVTIYCNSSIFGDIKIFSTTIIKAHSIIK